MAFGDDVDLTELRDAFDASRVQLAANKRAGQKDHEGVVRLASLAFGADILTRSRAWTQQDDQELRSLYVRVTDGTAARTVTATLTVDDGETKYLIDQTISVSVTTIIGTADARLDVRTTTGKRVRLLKGVRYRLDIDTSAGPVTGPLLAGVQTRTLRRGGAGGPPYAPRALRTGNLDVDAVNENLQQIADDIRDSMDARYTFSRAFFDLDGVTDTDAAVLRQFAIRVGAQAEVIGYELVGTDVDAACTWTASLVGDSRYPTVSIDGAGGNVEVYASLGVPFPVQSNIADQVIQLDASTATGKKINAGYLVVHFRCDRWAQVNERAPYEPDLFDAKTPTDSDTLQEQIDAIATAVALDADVDSTYDVRVECFVARNLASGSSVSFRTQGGARSKSAGQLGAVAYVAGLPLGAGKKVTFTIDGSATDVLGAGAAVRVVDGGVDPGPASGANPTVAADDTVITMTCAGGTTCPLAYLLLFWV